ncbi:hypothetical protein LMG27174_06622 [Paraburkholderia rhynchosiae]|uniref:Uncharacterized protein n=1 Tax=Paraburkholderia rhynchosiae TaxID=487049 RepID=A0A2N7W2B1_9BURK|nr:hypothetical protein C0Z16_32235 [Paraburkholderia rhynchosiae]CAB3740201.1 hypothetical protein LMG27174_06622 [Paraburkholderia rhynchosiae]
MGAGMAVVGMPAATLVDIRAAKKLTRLPATAGVMPVLRLIPAMRAMPTQIQSGQCGTTWQGLELQLAGLDS